MYCLIDCIVFFKIHFTFFLHSILHLLRIKILYTGMLDRLWRAYHPGIFTKPPRPTQLPTLSRTGTSTGQRAVMVCGREVKAACFTVVYHLYTVLKWCHTVEHCYHGNGMSPPQCTIQYRGKRWHTMVATCYYHATPQYTATALAASSSAGHVQDRGACTPVARWSCSRVPC